MSDVARLLPPNATDGEAALEQVSALRLTTSADALWDPARCPAALLPWLAWALSVDVWDPGWTEAVKREVIRSSVEYHRRKGTRAAVEAAIAAAGLGNADLIERDSPKIFDGSLPRDGSVDRSTPAHWAEYRVVMQRPLSLAQASVARAIIAAAAPVRSHLTALDFQQAALLYDGTAPRDGSYTRGIV